MHDDADEDEFDDIPPPPEYPESWDVLDDADLEWIEEATISLAGLTPERKEISQTSAENLKIDVPRSIDADNREKQITRLREARVLREEADNSRRTKFFWFAIVIAGLPVLVATITMLTLLFTGEATPAVSIAFFASVVVEVIGIATIIARYLFPSGGSEAGELPGETRPPAAD